MENIKRGHRVSTRICLSEEERGSIKPTIIYKVPRRLAEEGAGDTGGNQPPADLKAWTIVEDDVQDRELVNPFKPTVTEKQDKINHSKNKRHRKNFKRSDIFEDNSAYEDPIFEPLPPAPEYNPGDLAFPRVDKSERINFAKHVTQNIPKRDMQARTSGLFSKILNWSLSCLCPYSKNKDDYEVL